MSVVIKLDEISQFKDMQSPALGTLIYIIWLEGSQKGNSDYKIAKKEKTVDIQRDSYKMFFIISDFKIYNNSNTIYWVINSVSGTMIHA